MQAVGHRFGKAILSVEHTTIVFVDHQLVSLADIEGLMHDIE